MGYVSQLNIDVQTEVPHPQNPGGKCFERQIARKVKRRSSKWGLDCLYGQDIDTIQLGYSYDIARVSSFAWDNMAGRFCKMRTGSLQNGRISLVRISALQILSVDEELVDRRLVHRDC